MQNKNKKVMNIFKLQDTPKYHVASNYETRKRRKKN